MLKIVLKGPDFVPPDSDTLAWNAIVAIGTDIILHREENEEDSTFANLSKLWDIEHITNSTLLTCIHTEEWWNKIFMVTQQSLPTNVGENQATRVLLRKREGSQMGKLGMHACMHTYILLHQNLY